MLAERGEGPFRRWRLAAELGMLTVAVGLAACSPTPQLPDVGQIYAQVADAQDPAQRRTLITVPGLLGSRLIHLQTGTIVWGGGSAGLSADPDDPVEARLIALPILGRNEPLSALRDDVIPAGVLDVATPEILGIPFDIEVYGGIRRTLTAGGFQIDPTPSRTALQTVDGGGDVGAQTSDVRRSAPFSLPRYRGFLSDDSNNFGFDYDWRQDIAELALDFHRFVLFHKRRLAAQRSLAVGQPVDPTSVRLDLLAHSMGALVTRYYIMHGPAPLPEDGTLPPLNWAGAEHFDRVVWVAPPNAGSIIAFDNLVNGKVFGPLQPFYQPALLATHASAYQLMPRTRHKRVRWAASGGEAVNDIYDPALWDRYGWGLGSPAAEQLLAWLLPEIADPAERRRIAMAHQARMLRRAELVHRALDRWGKPPEHLETYLVVGGGFQTAATGELNRETGAFAITGVEEGDGVVLRSSVLLDERAGRDFTAGLQSPLRYDTVLFLPDEHVELTKNPVFGDNLLFWLLERPRDVEDLRRPSGGGTLASATQPAGGAGGALAGVLRGPDTATVDRLAPEPRDR
ncbi:MAG: hypothetical protein AAF713_16320 [Pseudomonadota bacterium]